MADPNGLPPPMLDPSQYPAYLDAQRKQQLAQMLMGSLQQANQTPADWNSMKVVPKRGMLQNVSVLADALMAGKAQRGAQTATAQYMQGLYGGGQPAQSAPQPPAQQSEDIGQTFPTVTGPINVPGQPRPGLVQQPAQQSQNSMIPPGMSRGQAQAYLTAFGPEVYSKMLQGTPEWQTALRANNGDAQAAAAQLRAEGVKKGAIANRSGEENLIPIGNNPDGSIKYQSIRTPNLSPDMDYTRNPDMSVAEAHNIPGAVPALAAQKGAATAADVANTPRMIPMGGGSEALRYPGDVAGLGTPPALRGAQTSQAPIPNQSSQAPRQNTAQPPLQTSQRTTALTPADQGTPSLPVRGQGGTFDNNLWANIPKMQIPNTPGQTTNSYQQKVIDGAAAKHLELVNKFGEASALATQSDGLYEQALRHLPAAETGPMSDYLTQNRGLLIELAPELAKVIPSTGTVTPTIELNKALVSAGLQGAKAGFGKITQGEVMLQKDEMSPSAKMTHEAIAELIHQAQIRNAYAHQTDKDYGEYHAQNGDPNRFESQYNVRRSITRFSAQYDTPPSALDRLRQQPQTVSDFKAKYGWDPTQ